MSELRRTFWGRSLFWALAFFGATLIIAPAYAILSVVSIALFDGNSLQGWSYVFAFAMTIGIIQFSFYGFVAVVVAQYFLRNRRTGTERVYFLSALAPASLLVVLVLLQATSPGLGRMSLEYFFGVLISALAKTLPPLATVGVAAWLAIRFRGPDKDPLPEELASDRSIP